ncbi:PREDICTED: uncharacterized protein LOC109583797 [Amphimedon queenslandica]|uniref:Poly [ADP-ribose] polymerase n=1 Tax=Amphimedon queenslandica TaxID=400682 RepID=A0A1X7UEH1_AMPQE|nr:PREDICTED: uncharacterized protein LOC109583797 [Amphimedon queenslandica]|eukprot:XP_019854829.1 PREDICTED: uncharacterized protein LOC109583797 [Amphimedon queenslandica]
MAAKGDGGNSLFQPLKEGLSLSKPSKPSLNLEHLSNFPVTLAKRKRSRDSTDELPDYIDDESEDDSVSLPITKRSPMSKQSPSIPSRSNTTPTATNPNIKPGTMPHSTNKSMSCPLPGSSPKPAVTRVSPVKATPQVKTRANDNPPAIQSKRKPISKPTKEKEGTVWSEPNLGNKISALPNESLFGSDNPFKSMGKITRFPNTPVTESSAASSSVHSFSFAAAATASKQDSKSLPKNTKGATLPTPIKSQQLTEGMSVSPLFVMKESKNFKIIGSNCISVSPDKQKIIVTGEKHQVEVIIDRLKEKFQSFTSKLKSKTFPMKAIFAPLLLEESFTKKLEDISQENLVEIRFVKLGSKEPLMCETVVSELKTAIGDKNLTLYHLYKANLLQQRESLKQEWCIQNCNGIWYKVSDETDDLFNESSQTTLEVQNHGQTFKVNLETKQAIGPDGFVYPMKSEDIKPTWLYHQDDDFGFVSYSDEISSLIEHCYKTHKFEPVSVLVDGDDCECYFNFQSRLEWNLTKKSNRPIKRDPPITPPFLSPEINLIITGYQSDIDAVEKSLHSFFQEKLKSSSLPPKVNRQLLEYRLAQYCVEVDCHRVTGVNQYADKVLLEEAVSLISFISEEEVPPEWAPQENDVEVFQVHRGTEEWNFVQRKWSETMLVSLKRIERIQNKWLWRHYCLCRERIKSKNRGMENEKWLFHGTRETRPQEVYNSEKGCDFRFSSSGMWGNGSYFADKASYSDDYKYQSSLGKQMFLVRVLTGDAIELQPQKLKMPPPKNPADKTVRYDSVKGFTKKTNIYIVYEHDKSYPAYLITY